MQASNALSPSPIIPTQNSEDILDHIFSEFCIGKFQNKCDLLQEIPHYELPEKLKEYPIILTSTLTGVGLERLREMLAETVLEGRINTSIAPPLLNMRQREALQRSLQSIQQAIESARNNESYEFIALDLHTAIDTLGEIMGKVTTEDILDHIFSEFCIGK